MKLTRTHVGLGLLSLALLSAGLVLWQGSAATEAPSAPLALPASATFAPSMQGTVPDGDVRALSGQTPGQSSGALAYGELRRMFDYYLSAVGEQSIESITQEIQRAIDQNVPQNQVLGAKRLLGRYLEFKRALVDLEKDPKLEGTGVAAIRQRFIAMQDLRARIFSVEEEQGMFGFEDANDMDALARLEIHQNTALSASQKRDQIAVLDANMPAALRADREAPRVVIQVEQTAQTMRANGASDDDIYRMRAKALDPQAAVRLAEVDREEKAWQDRIAVYLGERSKVLKSQADAPESERQTALNQLQQSQFSEEERRRLAAYEQ
ncbi:MAG: lipase secretion chaperone [Rhodoferax sp.]|nr:lipase secretion chaperone [Rhodoferax sp.]MDP3653087.1 lipase secretion chaperone [Rhodoferax sp.]